MPYIYSFCVTKVYGALRMTVKMFLMWNSKLLIDGGEDTTVATSLLEASNLIVLRVFNNSLTVKYYCICNLLFDTSGFIYRSLL